MKFLIDELIHFSLALGTGLVCYYKFDNPWLILVALLTGFFIDADHLFDYFAFSGLRFKLKHFLDVEYYMMPAGKVYIPLHGWEYVLVFWFLGQWIGLPGLEWAMSLTYFIHLSWDNFSFRHHPLAYSFIYRLLNNFSLESFK